MSIEGTAERQLFCAILSQAITDAQEMARRYQDHLNTLNRYNHTKETKGYRAAIIECGGQVPSGLTVRFKARSLRYECMHPHMETICSLADIEFSDFCTKIKEVLWFVS